MEDLPLAAQRTLAFGFGLLVASVVMTIVDVLMLQRFRTAFFRLGYPFHRETRRQSGRDWPKIGSRVTTTHAVFSFEPDGRCWFRGVFSKAASGGTSVTTCVRGVAEVGSDQVEIRLWMPLYVQLSQIAGFSVLTVFAVSMHDFGLLATAGFLIAILGLFTIWSVHTIRAERRQADRLIEDLDSILGST